MAFNSQTVWQERFWKFWLKTLHNQIMDTEQWKVIDRKCRGWQTFNKINMIFCLMSQVSVSRTRSREDTNQYLIWLQKIQTTKEKSSICHIHLIQGFSSSDYAFAKEEQSVPSGIVENFLIKSFLRAFNCKQKP